MAIPFQAGEVIVGGKSRYTITNLLSDKGGYGFAYKVENTLGNPMVAKVRREQQELANPTAQEFDTCKRTFELEFNVLQKLSHPQIPKTEEIFDFQGRRIMTMPFIEGQDLKDYMEKERTAKGDPLTVHEAVEITIDILGVLEYVHSFRPPYTHRDLKAENVIRTPQGKCVLLDFGAITQRRAGQTRRTSGAPYSLFMASPQVQMADSPSEPRDDIFSAGMLLEELIAGIPGIPFSNPNKDEFVSGGTKIPTIKLQKGMIVWQKNTPQEKPIDPVLEDIIFKARRFERDDRYQTAAEMRQALEQWLSGAPEIRLSASAHNFGQVPVGSTKSWPFKIENIGTKPLNLKSTSSTQACYKPSYSGQAVGVGGALTVQVEFAPVKDALVRGVIEIQSDDPNNPMVRVTLEGEGTVPKIEVAPTALDFGKVNLGWMEGRKFRIRNTGKADLEIADLIAPSIITTTPQAPFTFGPNQEREIAVALVPEDDGRIDSQLVIQSNDPNKPNVAIDLTAQAIAKRPTLSAVLPSGAEQGTAGLKLTIYGTDFPLEQFLLFDFGPGISVVNINVISHTNVEVTIDIDKNADTKARKALAMNKLGGMEPYELDYAFKVLPAKIVPKITSINPAQFYPGDMREVTIIGSGFAREKREQYYDTIEEPAAKGTRRRREYKWRTISGSVVSTNAPGVNFSEISTISPASLKFNLEVAKTCPAGNYDIIVTNPEGEQGVCQGLLKIQELKNEQGKEQVRCWNCNQRILKEDKICPICRRIQRPGLGRRRRTAIK